MTHIMASRRAAARAALIAVFLTLSGSGTLSATQARSTMAPHYRYILIDLGTFGGPQSSISQWLPVLNNGGTLGGQADTSTFSPHPSSGNSGSGANTLMPGVGSYDSPDLNVEHAFLWQKGVRTDLGALPGKNNSALSALNARGDAVGVSENGVVNPNTHYLEGNAVLWKGGRIINLGTLGGRESYAFGINDRDQIVGVAANTIHDALSYGTSWGSEAHAFLWRNGTMHDLGTLGGPDSLAWYINNRGQIAGVADVNATKNAATGQRPQHVFLWQDGHMQDLGSFGGAQASPNALNNTGEVAGWMNLKGDKTSRPFLWDGHTLRDLGTLGGANGSANGLNDAGEVVGQMGTLTSCYACVGGVADHAFLWRKGKLTDLGTLPGDTFSEANGINAQGQVVGRSGNNQTSATGNPFLWQIGVMTDLNTLIAPSDSNLQLGEPLSINDRGEIAGVGTFSGQQHAFLLIPSQLAAAEGIKAMTYTSQ